MAQLGWLNSFRLKPLILNLSEASWWHLVRVVGEVPRAGALGCLSLPLSPVPIHKPGQANTFTEFAAAAVVRAILPRPMGRGGGRRCDQCCAKPALPGHLPGEKAKRDKVSVCIGFRLPAQQDLASPCVRKEPPLLLSLLKQTPSCDPGSLAQGTYLLGISSPVGWHGRGDCELKDKNGSRSGFLLREAESRLPPHPRHGQRTERGSPQGLTLTDFAIDSHLQLQALGFLMVDRFGCKINP